MAMQDFLQSLMSGSAPTMPSANNYSSNFTLDRQKRIAFDPITGEPIKPKDRRNLKQYLQNPTMITPANALNANVPQWAGAMGNAANSSALANIINSVRGAK
jgi:hypothetical protein